MRNKLKITIVCLVVLCTIAACDSPTEETKVQSTPVAVASPTPTDSPKPLPDAISTSTSATVKQQDIDSSFENVGRIEENTKTITLNTIYSFECGSDSPVSTSRQDWKVEFDLAAGKWQNKVKEQSSCFGSAFPEWVEGQSGSFTIATEDGKTVIRADAEETDGSILTRDYFVVEYRTLPKS